MLFFLGCYYKREKKCYPVGTNKRVGCSRIECRLDATGKKASFVGTTTRKSVFKIIFSSYVFRMRTICLLLFIKQPSLNACTTYNVKCQ